MESRPTGVVRIGVFEVDFDARQLRRLGRVVHLQEKPFELLVALLQQPGVIVSRDELRSRLWPADTYVAFDDNLNTAAGKLRIVFGDSPRSPRYIETVPRQGYRWIAPIENSVPPERAVVPLPSPALDLPVAVPTPIASTQSGYPRQFWVVFWALVAVTASAAFFSKREARSFAKVPNRFELKAPAGTTFPNGGMTPNAAVSPDGRLLFFIARRLNEPDERIWIRELRTVTSRALEGTEGAWGPFWSPDSQRIGFVSNQKLKVIDLKTRLVRILADAPGAMGGGAWNGRDEIVYGPGRDGSLMRVPASGGTPVQTTIVDTASGEQRHLWPQFLPGDDRLLYFAQFKAPAESRIMAVSLRDSSKQTVLRSTSLAAYAASGHLLFVRDRTLLAQRLDLDRLALEGAPTVVAEDVHVNLVTGRAMFAASDYGVLVFSGSRQPAVYELAWFDRYGRPLGKLAPPMPSRRLALSPSGSTVAVEAEGVGSNLDLWSIDANGRGASRLTNEPVDEENPIWSYDEKVLFFARHRGPQAPSDLWSMSSDGQSRRSLLSEERSVHPTDVSRDGRILLFERLHSTRTTSIWMLPLRGGQAIQIVTPESDAREAKLSPNGRWIAYSAVERGRREVYLTSSSGAGQPLRVSQAGGIEPRWAPDGDELFFVTGDRHLAASKVIEGGTLRASPPETLMDLTGLLSREVERVQYDVSRDGRRFLVASLVREHQGATITLLLDWSAGLPH